MKGSVLFKGVPESTLVSTDVRCILRQLSILTIACSRKSGHKEECRPSCISVAMELARRALVIPDITFPYLIPLAIATLALTEQPTNANRFAVHVQCKTMPARPDRVMLNFDSFSRIPLEKLPPREVEAARKISAERSKSAGDLMP